MVKREGKRERIFAAALRIFSQRGFETATVEEIAREANVGKGTIYLHFRSKEELLHYLMDEGSEMLLKQIQDRIKGLSDPLARLKAAISAQIDFFTKQEDYLRFLVREVWGYRDLFLEEVKKIRNTQVRLLEEIIQEGIHKGVFRTNNPEIAAVGILGITLMEILHWHLFQVPFTAQELEEGITHLCLEGLLS